MLAVAEHEIGKAAAHAFALHWKGGEPVEIAGDEPGAGCADIRAADANAASGSENTVHFAEMGAQMAIGQMLQHMVVYMEKRREAEASLEALATAGGQPVDPAEFPLLAAELGITGSDLTAVAETVLSAARSWVNAAAAIEGARLKAKRNVDDARTAAEIDAVLAAIVWGA